jgi:PAS domain S-box-containing protein
VEEALRESEARRLAAEATKAERDRLYNVLEMLPAYTVLLSPDYYVPFANRFFRERFGESHGARCYEYLFNRTEPCEVCDTYRVLKTNAPHRWEWVGPDQRNYDVYDFPFTDYDGSPLIFEMGIDVTEMKQAQAALRHMNETLEQRVEERTAALRESEERFSLAFRHSPVGVHIFRFSDGCSVDANDAFLSLIEYSRDELIGCSAAQLNLFVDPNQREKWMQELLEHGAVRNLDIQIRGKSGRIVSAMFSLVKIELAGESMGLVMAIDITKRKQAEEQLRQHARELADANEDLARFNRAAVGRELRMIELKKQVNALCLAAGQPPRYPLEFEKGEAEETHSVG